MGRRWWTLTAAIYLLLACGFRLAWQHRDATAAFFLAILVLAMLINDLEDFARARRYRRLHGRDERIAPERRTRSGFHPGALFLILAPLCGLAWLAVR